MQIFSTTLYQFKRKRSNIKASKQASKQINKTDLYSREIETLSVTIVWKDGESSLVVQFLKAQIPSKNTGL